MDSKVMLESSKFIDHNLLMHIIHSNLRMAHRLYKQELTSKSKFLEDKLEMPNPHAFNMDAEFKYNVKDVFESLSLVFDIAREEYPDFSDVIDWLDSKNKKAPFDCWCIGCRNKTTNFIIDNTPSPDEMKNSLVSLGNGITPPHGNFKSMFDLEEEDY